jgi:hypothetical protein
MAFRMVKKVLLQGDFPYWPPAPANTAEADATDSDENEAVTLAIGSCLSLGEQSPEQ